MSFNLTTFVFELVNFVVLVWLLQRLLYGPLKNAIAKRREKADEEADRAREKLERAGALEAELAERAKKLDEAREHVLEEAREQAAEERARLLSAARQDAAAERARVQRLLEAERESASTWVREMAIEHSTEVAGRLLVDLAPDLVDRVLSEKLADELRRRGKEELSSGADGAATRREVEVTFAKTPTSEALDVLRAALTELFGEAPRLVTREDDSLGAGTVVRFGGKVFDASIRGQLDAFRDRVRDVIEPEVELG